MNYLVSYRRSMRLLTLLGIALFCTALEDLMLATLASAAAIIAWVLTEGPAGRPLPRWAINTGLLAATVAVLVPALTQPDVDPVASVGKLLVWLSIVKLFEPRTPRDQLQVIVISLMLVVAACLTNVTVQVGGLLLLYLPGLIATVALYQLYAGHEQIQRHGASAGLAAPVSLEQAEAGARWTRKAPRDLRRIMAVGLVGIGAGTFLVFILMPRGVGEHVLGRWEQPVSGSITGFKDHVQLGGQGTLTQSQAIVLEVKASTSAGPFGSTTTPLRLRGAVLDEYDPSRAIWVRSQRAIETMLERPAEEMAHGIVTKLEVAVRATAGDVFFTLWRPLRLSFEGGQYRSQREDGMLRTRSGRLPERYTVECAQQFSYPAQQFNRGDPIVFPVKDVGVFAGEALAKAQITLEQVLERNGDTAQVVEVLNAWLNDPKRFTYSTEMEAPQPGEDPIVMFLSRTRRGHCEYFASALAAMCRSAGVNARVVTGFLADEFDTSRGSYIVRESHAHAWVEAEISPGIWRTYDPSPAAGVQAAQQPRTMGDRVRRVLEAVEFAWITSVVGFSAEDQRATVPEGRPLLARLDELAWSTGLASTRQIGQPAGSQFLSMITNVVTVGSMSGLVGYVLILLAQAARRRLNARARLVPGQEPTAQMLNDRAAFYERMLRLLRRAGVGKPAWRPPAWHARELGATDPALGERVSTLTALYYQLRYQRQDLTETQREAVDAAMRDMQDTARAARRGRKAR